MKGVRRSFSASALLTVAWMACLASPTGAQAPAGGSEAPAGQITIVRTESTAA